MSWFRRWVRWRRERPNYGDYLIGHEAHIQKFRYDLMRWETRRPRRGGL